MQLYINEAWTGWEGSDTVVKLTDGSVWIQTEYHYEYRYAYRPKVEIRRDVMFVEGMKQGVRVRRVN